MLTPLPDNFLTPLVENAIREDLGSVGDITTDALIPANAKSSVKLVTRQDGIVAGMGLARLSFRALDTNVVFTQLKKDGEAVKAGDCLAQIEGKARAILSAERVALNFLCHLSGIATETHKLTEAVKPHKARIFCTRKTTPGLRLIEKYAVRAGGGSNHRFGLYEAVLIKDNHIAMAGGIRAALEQVKKSIGDSVKIELEVDTLEQLDEAIALLPTLPIDSVLLDNMTVPTLKQAILKVAGRFITEASGNITLQNVADVAATGVDVISVGWITHSAPILDIGLDVK
ncbi:MAG: carboxylating nicotinate-nucleotide diphosphorylase [Bdellovibrionales bacterium]